MQRGKEQTFRQGSQQARINNINRGGDNKSYRGRNAGSNSFSSRPNNNNKADVAWGGKKYCSLCGARGTHNASDGCYKMKNDKGENVQVIPSFDHCQKCETIHQRRLFHPAQFCPERSTLPKNNRK